MLDLSISTEQITELRWIGESKRFFKWYFVRYSTVFEFKVNE